MEIKENVPLKDYTSYKIGGPARFFCEPASVADIKNALTFAEAQHLMVRVLGSGTNVLVSDAGVEGLVIRIGRDFSYLSINNGSARVAAGLPLDHLITALASDGLGGFEQLAGIPGSVGGGIFMNAGAYGITLGDFVQESMVMDQRGRIKCLSQSEHGFSYRNSIFQHRDDLIILETLLTILPKPTEQLAQTINESKEKRRRLPLLPSCGSTFRNPPGTYAGKVIEELGLKGTQIGQAQISPTHANFIVNLGDATARDVYELIKLIQNEAAAYGITMKPEVRLWGQFE
ncbi:MAG TPA: UDP-N-acetylmuramate dehydrogenase [Firmicutes bacterium]|nr:UDP-N-acetylmuramate dehydrogenase [Bacillota bacterium]